MCQIMWHVPSTDFWTILQYGCCAKVALGDMQELFTGNFNADQLPSGKLRWHAAPFFHSHERNFHMFDIQPWGPLGISKQGLSAMSVRVSFALLSSNLCRKIWCFNLLKVHGVVDQTTCLFHNEPNGSEKRITTVWLVYMYGETKYWMLCSTKGVGRTAPDTKEYMALPDGVTVPLGKPVQTGIQHVRVSCPACILEWCLDLSVLIHHARLTIKEESTWSQFLFLHLSHMLSRCIEKPVHYHLFMVIWGKYRQAFSTMSTLCTTLPRSVCGMSWRSILTTSADAADVSEGSRR